MKMLWRRCKRNRAYAAVLAYFPVFVCRHDACRPQAVRWEPAALNRCRNTLALLFCNAALARSFCGGERF